MRKSKRVMRRAVLGKLFDHLVEFYGIEGTRESFVDGQFSHHQVDAILAFKSDTTLDELQSALDRLDAGTYGVCISCKKDIGPEVLDSDPARRVCSTCEQEISHVAQLHYAPHLNL
jgi:hypothetical protein